MDRMERRAIPQISRGRKRRNRHGVVCASFLVCLRSFLPELEIESRLINHWRSFRAISSVIYSRLFEHPTLCAGKHLIKALNQRREREK